MYIFNTSVDCASAVRMLTKRTETALGLLPIDLVFYVMGSAEENELLLMAALSCLFQAVDTILRKNLGKQTIFRRTVRLRALAVMYRHGQRNYKDTKLVFNSVYRLEIQSVMLVFATPM